MVEDVVNAGNSESIITKENAYKPPFNNNNNERQQSTAAGVITTNTKTATSFSFPKIHVNKLFNQSLNVVDINIDCYDIIVGHDLISYLGIDIHCTAVYHVALISLEVAPYQSLIVQRTFE